MNKAEQNVIDISIVVPYIKTDEDVLLLLNKILRGTKKPSEIIFVISEQNLILDQKESPLKTIHNRLIEGTHVKFIEIKGKKVYPGEARNIGIEESSNNVIGFLDAKTSPASTWLEKSGNAVKNGDKEIIFGITKYIAKSAQMQLFIDCTYGRKGLKTIPGTIAQKKTVLRVGLFLPNTRTGEDTDWLIRAGHFGHHAISEEQTTSYISTPSTLPKLIKKWFYSYYKCSTVVHHLDKQKNIYYLAGFVTVILVAMRWNAWFSGWNEESVLYIHYIGRVTAIVMFALHVFFRGIFMPVRKGVDLRHLLPARFMLIAAICLALDITKVTAYFAADINQLIRINQSD